MKTQIRAGHGTRSTQIGDEILISVPPRKSKFRGAWYCSRSGDDEVIVRLGYVNGLEPYIEGRLMSGLEKNGKPHKDGVPRLKLKQSGYDEAGYSWICVKVKVDDNGKMRDAKSYDKTDLEIIQSRTRFAEKDGLCPIAVLRRNQTIEADLFGTLRQIAYFDLKHSSSKPEKGRRRHFFSPA